MQVFLLANGVILCWPANAETVLTSFVDGIFAVGCDALLDRSSSAVDLLVWLQIYQETVVSVPRHANLALVPRPAVEVQRFLVRWSWQRVQLNQVVADLMLRLAVVVHDRIHREVHKELACSGRRELFARSDWASLDDWMLFNLHIKFRFVSAGLDVLLALLSAVLFLVVLIVALNFGNVKRKSFSVSCDFVIL